MNTRKLRKTTARITRNVYLPQKEETGFASSEAYKKAITKIYNREMNDIARFAEFVKVYVQQNK